MATALRILLLVFLPVRALYQAAQYVMEVLQPQIVQAGDPSPSDAGLLLGAGTSTCCAFIPLFLALSILFPMFFYRVSKNLHAACANRLQYTPGWAAGWFFVPFANLVVPYQVARELWHESDPARTAGVTASGKQPGLVLAWWLLWIAANVSDSLANGGKAFGSAWGSSPAYLAAQLLLWIPATLLAWKLVGELDRRVTLRVADVADTPPPQESWK